MGTGVLGLESDVEFWQAQGEFWRAEAGRWRGEAERLEAENAALRGRVTQLESQVSALSEKVSLLAGLAFGTSSEKTSRPTSGAGTAGQPADGQARSHDKPRRGQRRGAPGHGRRDYADLPTREEVHDISAEQRHCPLCGAEYVSFDEECSEQIDWQVSVTRIVHHRRRYRRGCHCPVKGILLAPTVPKAIGKGRFTTGFLARLLVEKFVLGRPTHRIAAALAADGLELAEGTLAGVLAACSKLLAPLADAICERNAAAAHLHADETRWNVYAPIEGKDSHRWWCWVFVGPDTTVFTITPSRSLAVLRTHLGVNFDTGAGGGTGVLPETLPGGRQLLVSSDFYTVYQCLGRIDGVDNLWCWTHIRRYFIRAADAHPQLATWADEWVARIGELYVAHTALRAAEPGTSEHTMATAQLSAAINTIDAERQAQTRHLELLDPAAAKVIATLNREWDGLARHREFPELPLDNNTAERALRGPVVGRKNYYGSGSVSSAELASRVWTITATAGRAGLNPLTYLHAYLDACAHAEDKTPTGPALTRFLPWALSNEDRDTWSHSTQSHTPTISTACATATAGPAP